MTAINSNRAIRGPVTAVPVVAGNGVRLVADTENNRWVVEADETVLWEGSASKGTVSLSESPMNFEYIAVYAQAKNPTGSDGFQYGNFGQFYNKILSSTLKNQGAFADFVHMDGNNTTTAFTWYTLATKWSGANTTTWTWCRSELNGNSVNDWYYLCRIVGIHRIASN